MLTQLISLPEVTALLCRVIDVRIKATPSLPDIAKANSKPCVRPPRTVPNEIAFRASPSLRSRALCCHFAEVKRAWSKLVKETCHAPTSSAKPIIRQIHKQAISIHKHFQPTLYLHHSDKLNLAKRQRTFVCYVRLFISLGLSLLKISSCISIASSTHSTLGLLARPHSTTNTTPHRKKNITYNAANTSTQTRLPAIDQIFGQAYCSTM